MGARERTVRGRGGGERHGVDEIGCGELRREPHERARAGGRPLDMGGDGLGSEGGGGRAEHGGRHEGGGSNDGKMSAEYARGLRESTGVGEAEVMLVWFRMRNGFRETFVMGLRREGIMERKLAGGGIWGGDREEKCRGRKTSAKAQHRNGCIGSEGMKRQGAGGRVTGGWLPQGGSNASGRKKGRVQCVRMLTCASRHIGRGPFTSRRNEPGQTHPEQEFML